MINVNKEMPNVVMNFGNGDICIAPGYKQDYDDKKNGYVGFKNQTPRAIAKGNTDLDDNTHYDEEFNVVMEFRESKSIDMLIGSLQCAKKYMTGMDNRINLRNGLITQKYTTISHESDFKFNAPHHFEVNAVDPVTLSEGELIATIDFQEGPIKENGVNGVANEDLIAMVICRLQSFQNTEYACRENAMAVTKLEESLMWLRKRTMDREERGVEGTSIK